MTGVGCAPDPRSGADGLGNVHMFKKVAMRAVLIYGSFLKMLTAVTEGRLHISETVATRLQPLVSDRPRGALLHHQPMWPNGQGVGLRSRRLRVRPPPWVDTLLVFLYVGF